jgi:hypothetical protein
MMPMFNLANLGAARSMETRPVNAPGMWGGQPPISGPFQAMPHPNLGMMSGMGGPPMSGPYQAQMPQMPMQQPMPHPVGPSYPMGPMQGPGGFHQMPNPGGPMQGGGIGGYGGGMNLGSLQNLMALSQMRGPMRGY